MKAGNLAARIGAALYVLWGLFTCSRRLRSINFPKARREWCRAGCSRTPLYLLFFAVSGIAIAVTLNWRNDRLGYWMNGILIAVADIPFVLFVLVPGLMPWWPGLLGPLLWIAALLFTSVGRFGFPPSEAKA